MKKVLFLLISALIVCSGCDIHRTEVIKPGVDIYTEYITVPNNAWEQSKTPKGEAGCYLFTTVSCKNIDRNVMDNGAVMVYMEDHKEGDNPLPYVFPVQDGKYKIMQNIRYNVSKGYITFIIEWDDADIYEIDYNIKFKVCIFAPEE